MNVFRAPNGFIIAPYSGRSEWVENVLRATGDIGAMLCSCWGVRQVDAESNRIFVQNVKPRDFKPCKPFTIQGRHSIDASGYFELTEPPGFAKELADHSGKGGRPAIGEDKKADAQRLRAEGKTYDEIADTLDVSKGTLSSWFSPKKPK